MKDKNLNANQLNHEEKNENLSDKELPISDNNEISSSSSNTDNSSFEQFVEDYENKLKELNNEKHLLEVDKVKFQNEVKSYQDRVEEWENNQKIEIARLDDKENNLKSTQQAYDQKLIELNAREAKLNQRENSLNLFESELKNRESSCVAYENRVKTDFENERLAWKKELEAKKNEGLENLKNDLILKQNEQNQKIDKLREKYHDEEIKLIDNQNTKEKEWLDNFEAKKQEELDKLKRELEVKKKEFDTWKASEETKLKEREENIKKLEDEQNEILNSKQSLEQKRLRLEQKETRLSNREKNIDNEIEVELKNKIGSLEEDWKKEKVNYETRINSLFEENKKTVNELDKIRRIFDRTGEDPKAFLNELISKMAKYDNHFSNTLENSDKVAEELEKLTKEKENLINQITDLNSKLAKATVEQSKLDVAKAQIDGLSLIIQEKDRIINDYEETEKLRRVKTEDAKYRRIEDIKKPILTQVEITNNRGRITSKPESINEMDWLENIYKECEKNETPFSRRIIYAFHTALKNAEYSPITVLAGISGTGKSLLPNLYADFGGLNFISVPVQPTWDSSESLLGLFNSLTGKFEATPLLKYLAQTQLWNPKFFIYEEDELSNENTSNYGTRDTMSIVLLDEMNLAHIELYFADFLSKLEERRGMSNDNLPYIDIRITDEDSYNLDLGRNVLWVGTMNQDETTKALSDKVLDRGAIIDFPRPKDLRRRTISKLRNPKALISTETWNNWNQNIGNNKISIDSNLIIPYIDLVNQINEYMGKAGRAIAHRVWQSIEGYMINYPLVIANKGNVEELKKSLKIAFEDQLIQKIMPKLRGVETTGDMAEKCLNPIRSLLESNNISEAIVTDFKTAMDSELNYGQFIWSSSNYFSQPDIDIGNMNIQPLDNLEFVKNTEIVINSEPTPQKKIDENKETQSKSSKTISSINKEDNTKEKTSTNKKESSSKEEKNKPESGLSALFTEFKNKILNK